MRNFCKTLFFIAIPFFFALSSLQVEQSAYAVVDFGLTPIPEPTGGTIPQPPTTLWLPVVLNGEVAAPKPYNLAEAYGVTVEQSSADQRWEVTAVRHLSGAENTGKHNAYVSVYDENGNRVTNDALRIGWTWEGRQPDEEAPPKKLDKPDGEIGHGDVPLEKGMIVTLWIEGDGLESSKVMGLHSMHPDEEDGNTWGHHSFTITFRQIKRSQ